MPSEALASVARERLNELLVQIGAELEAERVAQGLSVAELARRAHLSKRGVIYMRKVQCNPRLGTLVAQARALGCRLAIAIVSDQRGLMPPAMTVGRDRRGVEQRLRRGRPAGLDRVL